MHDGVAVIIDFILRASDALGDDFLCFVSDEAIYYGVGICNEVKAVNGDLVQASDCAIKRDDVFLEAIVGGGVVGGSSIGMRNSADSGVIVFK